MIRKTIGTILLVIGGLFIVVLLTYGGPVFPHVIGPITFAIVGALLLVFNRGAK